MDLQISSLNPLPDIPLKLINQILQVNRSRKQLENAVNHITRDQVKWKVKDDLLLYDSRLMVPDVNNLRTKLIAEIYNQIFTVYPGRNKTLAFLARKYY
jgi:hypothetical protein